LKELVTKRMKVKEGFMKFPKKKKKKKKKSLLLVSEILSVQGAWGLNFLTTFCTSCYNSFRVLNTKSIWIYKKRKIYLDKSLPAYVNMNSFELRAKSLYYLV
jgi:hypothetical protein